MIDKRRILEQLRAAKSAQIQWRAYTQALVSGQEEDMARTMAIQARTKFGRWYYGSGQKLNIFGAFDKVSRHHKIMQEVNARIFDLLYPEEELFGAGQENSGFLSWFRNPGRDMEKRRAELEQLLPQLVEASSELMRSIDELEAEVQEMPERDLTALLAEDHQHIDYERNFLVN